MTNENDGGGTAVEAQVQELRPGRGEIVTRSGPLLEQLAGRVGGRRMVLTGECQAPRVKPWSVGFELCDADGQALVVEVLRPGRNERRPDPFAYLRSRGRSVEEVFRRGAIVSVRGEVVIAGPPGRTVLRATHVSSRDAGTGPIETARIEATSAILRAAADRPDVLARFSEREPHEMPWPLHLALGEPVTSLHVVSARSSQTRADLLNALNGAIPDAQITHSPVPMAGPAAPGAIAAAIRRIEPAPGRVVVVQRGGGDWRDLAPFESEEVARAILDHPLRVLTAIGHSADVTLADRVAAHSTATPSILGEALRVHVTATRREARKSRPSRSDSAPDLARLRKDEARLARDVSDLRAELARERARRGDADSAARLDRAAVERERQRAVRAEARVSSELREHRLSLLALARVRIRLRAAAVAAAWVLGAGIALAVADAVPALAGAGFVAVPAVVAVVAVVVVLTGERRALLPVSARAAGHAPVPDPATPAWYARARAVSTPRECRRLFAGVAPEEKR